MFLLRGGRNSSVTDGLVLAQHGLENMQREDVVCDLTRAFKGEVAALMIVAELMVEAPTGKLELCECNHLRRGTCRNHDGITTVHVSSTDLDVRNDAFRATTLGGLIRDLILVLDHSFPELHELRRVLHSARHFGGAREDELVTFKFCPRCRTLADFIFPLIIGCLTKHKQWSSHRAGDRRCDRRRYVALVRCNQIPESVR